MWKVLSLALILGLAACRHKCACPSAPPPVVRSAEMRITAADPGETLDAVTRAIEAMGGTVAMASVWREGELERAHVTLRVPAGTMPEALARIRALAARVDAVSVGP